MSELRDVAEIRADIELLTTLPNALRLARDVEPLLAALAAAEARADKAEAKLWEPVGDNHHNAAACPYCSPTSIIAAERAAKDAAEQQLRQVRDLCESRILMQTGQERDPKISAAQVLAELSLPTSPTPETPGQKLGLNENATAIIDELRDLWQRALEREGNLASAVADVVWKAAQFGQTEDGDTLAYIVPKGAMHRLVGVAQSNGAHVPVSFRNPGTSPTGDEPTEYLHMETPVPDEQRCEHGKTYAHDVYRLDSGTHAGACLGPSGVPPTSSKGDQQQ